MLLWVVGGAVAAGVLAGGTVVGRRAVDRRATTMLAGGVVEVERRVQQRIGGTVRLVVEGEPLAVLRGLRDRRVPAARLVASDATLPNGLRVRRAVVTTAAGSDHADLTAHVTTRAVSRQLGVPGLAVRTRRGGLRLVVGLASVAVTTSVVDGRVVLRIPVAPPPIGGMLSAGLTELVPRPPAGVMLRDVVVRDGELVVTAGLDLPSVLALAGVDAEDVIGRG